MSFVQQVETRTKQLRHVTVAACQMLTRKDETLVCRLEFRDQTEPAVGRCDSMKQKQLD